MRSIQESCLKRRLFFGEESLRKAIQNLVAQYHSQRKHPGLRNQLLRPEAGHLGSAGEIQRRQRLGGMWNYYYRAAALSDPLVGQCQADCACGTSSPASAVDKNARTGAFHACCSPDKSERNGPIVDSEA